MDTHCLTCQSDSLPELPFTVRHLAGAPLSLKSKDEANLPERKKQPCDDQRQEQREFNFQLHCLPFAAPDRDECPPAII